MSNNLGQSIKPGNSGSFIFLDLTCISFINRISYLFQNEEFYGVIDELVDWLDETERAIKTTEPVDLAEDTVIIVDKFNKFKVY